MYRRPRRPHDLSRFDRLSCAGDAVTVRDAHDSTRGHDPDSVLAALTAPSSRPVIGARTARPVSGTRQVILLTEHAEYASRKSGQRRARRWQIKMQARANVHSARRR